MRSPHEGRLQRRQFLLVLRVPYPHFGHIDPSIIKSAKRFMRFGLSARQNSFVGGSIAYFSPILCSVIVIDFSAANSAKNSGFAPIAVSSTTYQFLSVFGIVVRSISKTAPRS